MFPSHDPAGEQIYKMQVSQRGSQKGKFVKATQDFDMCHECFVNACKNSGYKPKWETLVKNEQTGKWEVYDEQTKLDE